MKPEFISVQSRLAMKEPYRTGLSDMYLNIQTPELRSVTNTLCSDPAKHIKGGILGS